MKLHFVLFAVVVGVAGCKGKDKDNKEPSPGSSSPAAGTGSSPAAGSSATGSAAPGSAAPGSATAAGSGSAASGSAAPAAATYCGAAPCPCKAGSEQKSGDKISICELEKEVKIGERTCGPGRIVFHEGGALEECLLVEDAKVGDYTCKKGPLSTAFHKDGTLRNCSLAKDATIGDFTVTSGRGIKLHLGGKLRNAWSEKPVTIDGWSCHKDTYLFASGKLEACVVTAAGKVGTQDIPAGSMIRLTEDGKLRGLDVGAPVKVAGKPAKQNDRFCFEDGKPTTSSSCWMF